MSTFMASTISSVDSCRDASEKSERATACDTSERTASERTARIQRGARNLQRGDGDGEGALGEEALHLRVALRVSPLQLLLAVVEVVEVLLVALHHLQERRRMVTTIRN